MCLSTAYKEKKSPDAVIMDNVMLVKNEDGRLTFIDLIGRQTTVSGILQRVDLNDNYMIVHESD